MSAAPSAKSTDAVIQTLKWLRKQGFKPVPLHPKSKASINEKFASADYLPPPDDLWLSRDLGVGAVTGPKAGGPLDVDVDCEEALFFSKRFLPATSAVFGRKSKPRSHYLYRADGEECAKRAFIDPVSRSTIIEIRADGGHQTVFPGSLHEATGELIEWSEHAFPEVPRIGFETLSFAVKKVAIAVMVVRHMWAEGQRNEICKHLAGMLYYLEWTQDEVKSLISAVMEFTGDTDRTRLRTVSITYAKGEKGGKITGGNTLSKFMGDSKVVDRILEWAGSPAAALLQDYNERFAVVTIEGKFRIAETAGMTRGQPPTFFAKDDFLNLVTPDTMEIDTPKGPKRVSRGLVWLKNERRRTYRSVDFLPGVEDNDQILNMWTGWPIDPDPTYSCQAWLDLLNYTICGSDDAVYSWMLHWFANIVREPTKKPLTAPVIIGKQGVGKSLLMDYYGKILGSYYIKVTNEEHIYGRFNKHLATTLLLHSEEALFGGDKKHRGIVKSLITDDTRIFEQKGVDAKHVSNFMRIAMTSNEQHAAPVEVGDRRYTVIDMDDRRPDRKMIEAVLKEIDNGGPASLFHYLMTMPYDSMVPRINVKNEALGALKQVNLDPVASWWLDTLRQGQVLPDYLAWATKPIRDDWPQRVSSSALYVAYMIRTKERGARQITDRNTFALALEKMIGTRLDRSQRIYVNPMSDEAPREVKLMPNKQYTIMNLPELNECRKSFCEFLGQDLKWPSEPDPEDQPVRTPF